MITSKTIKKFCKMHGADLVGISSMDRFEGAPKQMDIRYVFPGAKSLIVMGFRIARGSFRGIEEGTYFTTYSSLGYAGINQISQPMVLWKLSQFVEDHGYEAVAIPNMNGGEAVNPVNGNFRRNWSVPVSEGRPYPDVLVHFRIAAFCAGLGEIGWSKIFLTPEFGPRQRFVLLLTDAKIAPDPLYEGKICDRCKLCVSSCAGRAISKDESVKIQVAGRTIEWGKFDPMACEKGLKGGLENELNPFLEEYPRRYGYGRAIEGGAGCMRACMIHLEKRKILKNKFKNPFRTRKPWKLDHLSINYELTDDVKEYYKKTGNIEDALEYMEYSRKDNFGIEKAEKVNPLID